MKPLIVTYYRRKPDHPIPDNVRLIDSFGTLDWDQLKREIESGEIEGVILQGAGVPHGWRLFVNREVVFVNRPTATESEEVAQLQAAYRILQAGTHMPRFQ